jgi:hypothetical protein
MSGGDALSHSVIDRHFLGTGPSRYARLPQEIERHKHQSLRTKAKKPPHPCGSLFIVKHFHPIPKTPTEISLGATATPS